MLRQAHAALAAGREAESLALLRRATAREPANAEALFHLGPESPRAVLDLTLRWHDHRPGDEVTPLVLGAEGDRISTPADARATAELYETRATIVPGLAHMMMLDRKWEAAAEPLLQWLESEVSRGK